jgi:hypothetical protein
MYRRSPANWERAARLLGFADTELLDWGASWPAVEGTYREQSLHDIEGQFGAEFERYYDSGRIGNRRDLIYYALGQTTSLTPNPEVTLSNIQSTLGRR